MSVCCALGLRQRGAWQARFVDGGGQPQLAAQHASAHDCCVAVLLTSCCVFLPSAALPINWALGRTNDLVHHSGRGSLSISLTGGSAVVDADDSTAGDAFRIAHGALMLAAFVLMMPTAVLMARHKWMFGDKQVRRLFFLGQHTTAVRL